VDRTREDDGGIESAIVADAVFQPIETPTAVEEVAKRIRQAIVLGVLRDGDRLPAETELARRIGVGVMTVRAALAELRNDGLLETHRGRLGGSFVVRSEDAVVTQRDGAFTDAYRYRDVAEILGGLEGLAAARAANSATKDDRDFILAIVDEMDADDVSESEQNRLNHRFHLAIAKASLNQALLTEITRRRADLHAFAFDLTGLRLPQRLANDEHRAIAEAIARGDSAAAQNAMWIHHEIAFDEILLAIEP
jgi:GntR family transcriptional repressor for pyruvate dehydrogenase complex